MVLPATLAGLMLLVYLLLNTSFSFRFTERPRVPNYEMLAESFLAGQLYLKKPVDPARLNARNPLDPSLPYPFLMDGLIFNGKYYFTHEPLPAVFRALWMKLTGSSYSTGAIVIICAWVSFLLMGFILWKIRQTVWPTSSLWVFYYAWAGFGISAPQLYISSAPVVYNESVAMGCSFVLAGSYFLFRGLVGKHRSKMNFLASGILFGAAIGCRAELVIYPVTFCMVYLVSSVTKNDRFWLLLKRLCLFGGPVGIFVAALLTYNHLRFGSFLDFGRSYLMSPRHLTYVHTTLQGSYFSLDRVPFQLYNYLLSFPKITSKFPFVRYPFGERYYGQIYTHVELACSIFLTAPLLLGCVALLWINQDFWRNSQFRLVTRFCIFASLGVLCILSTTVVCTARHVTDFTPLLYVVLLGALVGIDHKWRPSLGNSKGTLVVLGLLFAGQLLMGLLLGLTGMIQWPAGK